MARPAIDLRVMETYSLPLSFQVFALVLIFQQQKDIYKIPIEDQLLNIFV
jgi:hypothetical protein